eukprot:NODE_4829_length_624_cov_57.234783_g4156_i0.p1 GENE.NODE_4829_length_624_cov_57.234783_g4156_i0~~NODE_4829_length_624_cov_57.234783_g4156_i0.p1  ORF type:complete len:189 (+),score=74.42 NODE_4829_length_624_cov_57.234783_g4156_i0:43-567(+)
MWEVAVAYSVLKDPDLRRIYDTLGYWGVRKSEEYSEYSVFECDPYQVYDDFFEGKDPEDRDYLLLNGNAHLSESEQSEDEEKFLDLANALSKEAGDVEGKQIDEDGERLLREGAGVVGKRSMPGYPDPADQLQPVLQRQTPLLVGLEKLETPDAAEDEVEPSAKRPATEPAPTA